MDNFNFEALLKDSLKMNVMSQIETGNPYIDAIMRMIMLTMLTAITGRFIQFVTEKRILNLNFNITRKIYLWWKQPKRILITGHIFRELRFLHIRFDFSQRFKAILHKILKSMSTEKNKKLIKKIKELQVRDSTRYYEKKEEEEFNFIVDQKSSFEIDAGIFCEVNTYYNNLDSGDKKTSINKEEYQIEIWSLNMNCQELLQYIEKITDEYEKEQRDKSNRKKYIFTFDGRDSETGVKWQVNEFMNKRSLDHVFFEEKEEVVHFLEKFMKERELYEKIGKPYQLGILLEGEPGCGKTSFIVALANYFNRSIKDCQFNRMKTIDDLESCIHCICYDNKDMSIDKVIMVAEDFDCMTDLAKSRKLIQKESDESIMKAQKRNDEFQKNMGSFKSEEAKAILCAIASQDDMTVIPQMMLPKNDPSKSRDITLSSVLNIMDGINNQPGRIIIFTTNHPETLDDAFLRPGRIDLRIKFGRPSRKVMYDIIKNWYKAHDEFYPGKNLVSQFEEKWEKYYERLQDHKFRPCDITNILQKFGDNMERTFIEFQRNAS
jgi:SpoVK/Ycf46/Vps4 family AAA+-type ATPase